MGICPKVNVIARLEYELAYYDSAVHRFNHYTVGFKIYMKFPMWGLKVFSVEVTNVWFEGFYESQWLRARLCCRKISDSISWLFSFTPR